MALIVKSAKRKFIIVDEDGKKNKEIELKDPHPSMSLEEVIGHYSAERPELTTAAVEGPTIEGDTAVYKFTTVLGDKG